MAKQEVLESVRASRFRYSSFSRTTEHVAIHGDIAVTFGGETEKGHQPWLPMPGLILSRIREFARAESFGFPSHHDGFYD
jgi:hypothetical protein